MCVVIPTPPSDVIDDDAGVVRRRGDSNLVETTPSIPETEVRIQP